MGVVLAIVVVAALVIGIWAGAGCSEKDPNPTDAVVTDPTGTTGGNDVTDPTNPSVTDPSDPGNTDPSDPTGTPDNPAQPTDPGTTPTEPPKPPVSTDQFGGVTPSTIRYSDWQSWDRATRQAFYDKYIETCSDEEYHNIVKATVYKDYECGFEGHLCRTENGHKNFLEMLEKGCSYCGKHDCSSFFVLAGDGYYNVDVTICPEYDVKKDPTKYCKNCGLPVGTQVESGEKCCHKFVVDTNCDWCGEPVKSLGCHHCIKP